MLIFEDFFADIVDSKAFLMLDAAPVSIEGSESLKPPPVLALYIVD